MQLVGCFRGSLCLSLYIYVGAPSSSNASLRHLYSSITTFLTFLSSAFTSSPFEGYPHSPPLSPTYRLQTPARIPLYLPRSLSGCLRVSMQRALLSPSSLAPLLTPLVACSRGVHERALASAPLLRARTRSDAARLPLLLAARSRCTGRRYS